uniref:HTH_33 domain-containing protein n=1 Tax=Heterorhabditis bacteriophora TaxID=37862 RepID=A0A1I7WVW0_HETBA
MNGRISRNDTPEELLFLRMRNSQWVYWIQSLLNHSHIPNASTCGKQKWETKP